jgi:hypothetical protein
MHALALVCEGSALAVPAVHAVDVVASVLHQLPAAQGAEADEPAGQ